MAIGEEAICILIRVLGWVESFQPICLLQNSPALFATATNLVGVEGDSRKVCFDLHDQEWAAASLELMYSPTPPPTVILKQATILCYIQTQETMVCSKQI